MHTKSFLNDYKSVHANFYIESMHSLHSKLWLSPLGVFFKPHFYNFKSNWLFLKTLTSWLRVFCSSFLQEFYTCKAYHTATGVHHMRNGLYAFNQFLNLVSQHSNSLRKQRENTMNKNPQKHFKTLLMLIAWRSSL